MSSAQSSSVRRKRRTRRGRGRRSPTSIVVNQTFISTMINNSNEFMMKEEQYLKSIIKSVGVKRAEEELSRVKQLIDKEKELFLWNIPYNKTARASEDIFQLRIRPVTMNGIKICHMQYMWLCSRKHPSFAKNIIRTQLHGHYRPQYTHGDSCV